MRWPSEAARLQCFNLRSVDASWTAICLAQKYVWGRKLVKYSCHDSPW